MSLTSPMRAILTYHSLDDSGSALSVSPDVFRDHVEWMATDAIDVVPLDRLLRLPPDRDALAITFDDGFRNFAELAWPLLRDRALPVTLFVVTRHLGRRNDWGGSPSTVSAPDLPLLGWDDVASLADEGVDIGSHTRNHPDLTELSTARITDELAGSAQDLAGKIGRRPRALAYPFGRVTPEVEAAAREHYDLACTTRLQALGQDPPLHHLPRLDAYYLRKPGQLSSWGKLSFRARIRVRAGGRYLRQRIAWN